MKKKQTKASVFYGEIGKPITRVRQVCELADKGKSVWHSRWGRPVAGAWLQNMQARAIVGFIRMGWLYYYKPKSKKKS